MKGKVYLIDVTNRDGVQTSRILLPKLSKTMLNIYLDEMGLFQSEIGFPTLKHEINYINANLELVKLGAIKRTHLEGWCRAIPEDVRLSFKNCPELKHLNISMSTSEIMIKGKFQGKRSFKDIIKSLIEAVKTARELGAETVGINAEDASRTELDRLIEFTLAGKEAGADRFRYCDTLGTDDPITIYERAKALALATKFPLKCTAIMTSAWLRLYPLQGHREREKWESTRILIPRSTVTVSAAATVIWYQQFSR